MSAASDEALMATYALGDLDAFDVLFGRYEGRAYAFFLSRVRSHAHALDLFQELFLRVHRGRGTFRPGARFEPWFFQIARRVLIDDVRRRGPPLEALHEGLAGGASGDAERALQASEAVAEVLAELTEEERVILLAAKGDDLDYSTIARALGRTTAAVKQIASRATRRLRSRREQTRRSDAEP
jgi:RNA polymerase sigma-70 factor (ECF subfamily)